MRGIADGWTYVDKALLKDDTNNQAVLPFELWDFLSEYAKEDRLAIAVEPLSNFGKARSVLCWAVKASNQSQASSSKSLHRKELISMHRRCLISRSNWAED